MFHIHFCIVLLYALQGAYSGLHINQTKDVYYYTSEAFFVPIDRRWFSDLVNFSDDYDLEYSASLLNMPDLPRWMFCQHPSGFRDAFLYGSPEEPGIVHIQIIALNKTSYDTYRKVMKLNVQRRKSQAQYEVEMKFLNLNVEDMFQGDRLSRLVELFRSDLWEESDVTYVTMVVSSLDVGGRLPLNPKEKEGVVVRVGGNADFSRKLQDLERQVQPLRNRMPCPRDYKKTFVEYMFRRRNFISDWCSFRLVTEEKRSPAESSRGLSDPAYSSILLTSDDFKPQSVNLPRRDFLFDFIVSIVVPCSIVTVISMVLTCVVCCNREGMVKREEETESLQMSQYNSIQRTTNQVRHLAIKGNDLPHSGSTAGSSLPRSRTASPSSTLPKASTTRPSSRTGTLRGLMLPPPPPYTPPSSTYRRSAISQTSQ